MASLEGARESRACPRDTPNRHQQPTTASGSRLWTSSWAEVFNPKPTHVTRS